VDLANDFAIEAWNLTKSVRAGAHSVEVFRGASIAVATGEFVAVTGPPGCGKTILLSLLGGLERPTSGLLRVCGEEVTWLSDDQRNRLRRGRVSLVPQANHLVDILTLVENVGLPLVLAGMRSREVLQRSLMALDKVGLANRSRHRPADLSGGEQQRVAIARALAADPTVLLVDEPTSLLDSDSGRSVVDLLRMLVREMGLTLLIATQDSVCANQADREVQISDGRLFEAGTFTQLTRLRAA
jgi:predicted ABC-type transport system involved in lysophospholipase L1 biosynthesis ATPase subunit